MGYLDDLKIKSKFIRNELELLLSKYKVQPVGSGYIDMITANELVEDFIEELTSNHLVIEGVTWWCHCTEKSKEMLGCPHGIGGPGSDYYDGWFSETQIPMFLSSDGLEEITMDSSIDDIKSINDAVVKYIKEEFPKSNAYIECLVPALWLLVPDDWER
ncbi:MAG TPA: hypothetical protein VNM45_19820 [Bacillus sp. (in: firmicutes)]|nr:hypothetical protein [Bacillus sp. (in: firmicutes)]